MSRAYRRRPSWSLGIVAGLFCLIAGRYWLSPRTTLSQVPAGLVRLESVAEGPVLYVVSLAPQLENRTQIYHLRLIGIAPANSAPVTDWLRENYSGQTVRVELDKRRLDSEGNCLVYLYAGNRFINAELVRRGLANYDLYPGDSARHAKELKAAAKEAALAQR